MSRPHLKFFFEEFRGTAKEFKWATYGQQAAIFTRLILAK